MENLISALMQCAVFDGVDEKSILNILQQMDYQRKNFKKGVVIFRTGDLSNHLGIILNGCIEIKQYLPSGNVVSVFHRGIGELVGGCIVFSDKPEYPYDVIAKDDSELLFISKPSIMKMLPQNSFILENMLRIFANRVQIFEQRLNLFSFSSIQKKIAFSLLNDFQGEQGTWISLPFSQTTWAEYLNVSRPSLCRELKVLCDEGIINMEKNQILITDKSKLQKLLQS